jgi:hypothetical protein
MQGMKFLIVGQDGRPVNHGTIVNQVGAEKFLCQFARSPSVCRLVHTDEILGWNLFPTDELMNAFITDLTQNNPPAEDPPGKDPKQPQKKKVSKKKRNAKTKR